jgi:hypothetical protein
VELVPKQTGNNLCILHHPGVGFRCFAVCGTVVAFGAEMRQNYARIKGASIIAISGTYQNVTRSGFPLLGWRALASEREA